MEQNRIRQNQEDKLNQFMIEEKEKDIEMLKLTTKIKIEQLERNLKYLKGLRKE